METKNQIQKLSTIAGTFLNEIMSFIVFALLDILDFVLCYVYRVADFLIESECKPCYCSSSKEVITRSGKILVSEQGQSKIIRLTCSKVQLEEISDTLYTRPSLVSEASKSVVTRNPSKKTRRRVGTVRPTYTVNSTIIEMLQAQQTFPVPRWSDCNCETCTSWTSSREESLFVKADGVIGKKKQKQNELKPSSFNLLNKSTREIMNNFHF